MAVDAINGSNPVLPAALQAHVRTSVPLAASPLATVTHPVAVAVAVTENLTPEQQAAMLGHETVRTLNSEPSFPGQPLLANGAPLDLATVLESEGLSPAQQAALAVNETVQAAIETQNQTPAQQAALAVGQATTPLAAAQASENAPAATAVAIVGQAAATTPAATAPAAGTVTKDEAAEVVQPAAGTSPATAAAVPAPATEADREARTPAAQPMVARPIPYANAFVVYEVRNLTPPPGEPAPPRRDLHPAQPTARVRAVDPLVLRQEWEKRKKKRRETGQATATALRPPLAEKAIRELIGRVNADLTASGVPLHLVLARNEAGLALDVYECLDEVKCEMAQEVPLDLHDLLTVLDNLEHETGILVNIKT